MEKLKGLLKSISKDIVLYVVFGVCTTLISMASFWVFNTGCGIHYLIANIFSWVLAVAFAYVTNKLFVFRSRGLRGKELYREIVSFVAVRLVSLGLEQLLLLLLIEVLFASENLSKVIVSIFVIVFNYIFSKWFIFKGKKETPEKE